MSSNARPSGGELLAQHASVIDAARSVGTARVVYTSHIGVSASSAFPPMHDHAATKDMLGGSGMSWTALCDGLYAASGADLMGNALDTGVLAAARHAANYLGQDRLLTHRRGPKPLGFVQEYERSLGSVVRDLQRGPFGWLSES